MRLGDFLSPSAGAIGAPTKLVKFRVVGINPQDGARLIVDAEAALAFVSEHERQEALRDARREMAAIYGNATVPSERLADEEALQLLRRALRDKDNPRAVFAESSRDMRNAISQKVAARLISAYYEFVDEEFPDAVTQAEFDALEAEAKKK